MISPMSGKAHGGNFQHAGGVNNQASGLGYDASGNLTNYTAPGQYVYDPENRIQSTVGVTYTYDADGNRVEKSGGTSSMLYWYGAPGIIAESDLSGTLKSEYIFFNGKRLARIDLPAGTVHYYLSDHLNSTSMVVSGAGVVEDESDYSPYGTEYQITSGANHYKFTGKERDSESGLDYFGARYYSNGLGRFITPDWAAKPAAVPYAVLGDPQSLNLYSYVRNVPTTRFDVDGHFQSSLIDKVSPLPPPPPPVPAPSVPKDVPSVNVPGQQYKTVDQAAKSAIRSTNHKSVTENKEIAGRVVKNSNGSYGVTKGPESGRAVDSSEPGDVRRALLMLAFGMTTVRLPPDSTMSTFPTAKLIPCFTGR